MSRACDVKPNRIVVFDIELARNPDEFPDKWSAALRGDCGISIACVWDGLLNRYFVYDGRDVDGLADHLELADLVVGFNSRSFDLPVVESVAQRRLEIAAHHDIKEDIYKATRKRVKGYKLKEVAERTLGVGKDEGQDGAEAPHLWKSGQIGKLVTYCLQDVNLTKMLYNHIALNGSVVGPDGSTLQLGAEYYELA